MSTKSSKSAVVSSSSTSTPAPVPAEIANVPSVSPADIAAFMDAIDNFALLLGAGFQVPQPEESKRMPKPRKEAPTIIPMVADLATRYGIASQAFPTATTLARQQTVNTLGPVAERIAAVQKLVVEVARSGQSGAWEGAMVTYGLLKSEARGNAVLRNALTPIREKMRATYDTAEGGTTKVRSRRAPKPPKTTGKASAAPAAASDAAVSQPATAAPAEVAAAPASVKAQ